MCVFMSIVRVLLTQLTSDNLAVMKDRVTPNKPLAILLSHHLHPSFLFKLTAFSFQEFLDFSYVTSDLSRKPGSAPVVQYLNASSGVKQLTVIKEASSVAVVVKV